VSLWEIGLFWWSCSEVFYLGLFGKGIL